MWALVARPVAPAFRMGPSLGLVVHLPHAPCTGRLTSRLHALTLTLGSFLGQSCPGATE